LTISFSYDRIALTFADGNIKRKWFLDRVNMDEETDARTVVSPNKIKGCCASGTIKTKSVYKLCTG